MDTINIDSDKWVTQQILADNLGISVQRVHNWIKRNKIETKYIKELKITLVNKHSIAVKTIN